MPKRSTSNVATRSVSDATIFLWRRWVHSERHTQFTQDNISTKIACPFLTSQLSILLWVFCLMGWRLSDGLEKGSTLCFSSLGSSNPATENLGSLLRLWHICTQWCLIFSFHKNLYEFCGCYEEGRRWTPAQDFTQDCMGFLTTRVQGNSATSM